MSDADGYIIEYQQHGRSVKVTAFDPVSLTEVSIIGAQGAPRHQLAQLAIRKLQYMMAKNKNSDA